MDPLILYFDELIRARANVDKYESELSEYEARIDFTPQNARYNRLLLEKEHVLKYLCDLRLELSKKGKSWSTFYWPSYTTFSAKFLSS